jgi:hypothetical protein
MEAIMAVIKTETFHEAWDCSGCDTRGLSAYNCKQCPNCGAPLDDESVYRTRKPVENYSFKGHDIHCAHCNTRNEKRFSCRNCGASLTDNDDERVKSFTYKSDTDGWAPKKQRPSRPRSDSEMNQNKLKHITTDTTKKWWYVGGVVTAVAAVAIVWIISQLNAVIPATLTADKAAWTYYLALEDYQPRAKTLTVEDGDFGSPPNDAYNIDSDYVFIRLEPIYESRSVSQTCTGTSSQSNGDGTWSETTYSYDCSYTETVQVGTRPIWGTRYEYTIDRWESITPLTKKGTGQRPDFPTFTTPTHCLSLRPTFGCKRAPDDPILSFTIYFFYFDEDDGTRQNVERTMSRDIWDSFRLGTDYPAVLNGFGTIRAIKGIDSEYDELMGD